MIDIKYIDNDISKGILIDWKKVKKEFKKLNIPNFVHSPIDYNFNKNAYFIELSERSVGKTTNWLLLGIIFDKYLYLSNLLYHYHYKTILSIQTNHYKQLESLFYIHIRNLQLVLD